jgi:hypothetical protein
MNKPHDTVLGSRFMQGTLTLLVVVLLLTFSTIAQSVG